MDKKQPVPAKYKATTSERRIVVTILDAEGKPTRRLTVQPTTKVRLRLKPGERVVASSKTAGGDNLDQKRGGRGAVLKVHVPAHFAARPVPVATAPLPPVNLPPRLPGGAARLLPRRKVRLT